jgi:hypothetical protein
MFSLVKMTAVEAIPTVEMYKRGHLITKALSQPYKRTVSFPQRQCI